MQTEHGTTEVRILGANIENRVTRRQVDGGQKDARAACLTGPLDDLVAISGKLFAIQMAMGVDEL